MTEPLTWQNDTIYFDKEPLPVNEWVNANELINEGKIKLILSEDQAFNFFPILVRRVDFVREKQLDRVLARFPYIELSEEEKEVIKENQLLIAEKLRDYFYKSDNRKILAWRDILLKNLQRGFVPLPFLRCFPDEITIDLSSRKFESARGERFNLPNKLTEEIAYLCGMVNGDGSLKKYVLSIIDYSFENISQLKQRFIELFTQTGRIQKQTENSPELIITNLWVVRFFSILTSHPIGGKKYSKIREPLLLGKEPYRSVYWSGVMDADGSYKNRNVTFTSASKKYTLDFKSFLETLGITGKYTERPDNTFTVYIPAKYHQIYKTKMISLHPEKKLQFMQLRKGREVKSRQGFIFQRFKEETLINGFFNFALLDNIQILGLDEFLKSKRGNKTLVEYAKEINVDPSSLQKAETKSAALSLKALQNILARENLSLMPFLFQYGKNLQFRKLRAPPVVLDYKPNKRLLYYTRKMIFYNSYIAIDSNDEKLKQQLEDHFGIEIENFRI
ncbi:MAG: LAGLIDADG family homing endonuclease, partial [Candidatus Heimdallarchaeota archaeon]